MKINVLLVLLLMVACQPKETDKQAQTISEKIEKINNAQTVSEKTEETNNVQNYEEESDWDDLPQININKPSWDLVRSAFQKIDSFPIKCSIFPLQAIIIEGDTLKVDGDICYSFPLEITTFFVENYVSKSDSLAIWFEDNSSYIRKGTDFEYGIYPFGTFKHASKDYYIYYTLDYLTGRGSYRLSFYMATDVNQRWESKLLGERSYSKFNSYEVIDGEEFMKDRMASERNLIIELQENKLVITDYSGVHVVGEEFDVFEEGEISTTTELILD